MKPKIKVLFPFVGDSFGGSYKSAILLISGLLAKGVDVSVLLHRKGVLSTELERNGIHYEVETTLKFWQPYKFLFFRLICFLLTVPAVFFYLKRKRYNIIHVHDGRMSVTYGTAAWLAGVKTVHHQRTKYYPSHLSDLTIKLSTSIVCISKFVKETIPRNSLYKSEVVYNPIDPPIEGINAITHEMRQDRTHGIDETRVLFLGALKHQKRPALLIEAFHRLSSCGYKMSMIIAGKGDPQFRSFLTKMIEDKKLATKVKVIDFVSDIGDLLRNADFLVAPSVDEGFGRNVVEAILHGKPVLASKSGGHVEIFHNGGVGRFFVEDDFESLCEEMAEMIENRMQYEQRARSSADEYQKRFCKSQHADAILEIYRNIAT